MLAIKLTVRTTASTRATGLPAAATQPPTTLCSSDLVGGARAKKEQEGNTHGRSSFEYRARRGPWRRDALGGWPGSPARRRCGSRRRRVSAAGRGESQPAAQLRLGELRL